MALSTTALILESNNETFLRGNNTLRAGNDVGLLGQVPTPDGGGTNEGDYWAVPVNNHQSVTSIAFYPYNVLTGLPAAPKPYAVAATKIRVQGVNTFGKPDYYFVLGTSTQWAAASLPNQTGLVYWPGSQMATPITNSNGIVSSTQFRFELGLPTLPPNGSPVYVLYPVGYYNGVALTASAGAGYSTPAALLTFLNANWSVMGSPSITITWSLSPNQSSVVGVFTYANTDQYNVPSLAILDAWIYAAQ